MLNLFIREAYKIACLGVTDGDWRVLALEALEVSESAHESTQNLFHAFMILSYVLGYGL